MTGRGRFIRAIAAYALLGLATSIAVAWAGALVTQGESTFCEGRWNGWEVTIESDGWWQRAEGASPLNIRGESPPEFDDLEPLDAVPAWSGLDLPCTTYVSHVESTVAGWPWLCLSSQRYLDRKRYVREWDHEERGVVHGRIPMQAGPAPGAPGPWRDLTHLPRSVRPIQMAANTVFFAVVWFVAMRAAWLIWWHRRAGRRRRGRCVRCRHLLTDATRCPECGTPRDAAIGILWPGEITVAIVLACLLAAFDVALPVRFAQGDERPPLHLAAYRGDVEGVQRIIDGGALVDELRQVSLGRYGEGPVTPLMLAAAGGDRATVRALLDAGADPDLVLDHLNSAILAAVEANNHETAEALIEAGVDVNGGDGRVDPTPIWIAGYMTGDVEMLDRLVAAGADPNWGPDPGEIAILANYDTYFHRPLRSRVRLDV